MQRQKSLCRVFFHELLKSDLIFEKDEEIFIVTPTCAICSNLFGVAEIKEAERRGNVVKLKIADHTATINVYANETLIKLKEVNGNIFLAFSGNFHVGRGRKVIVLVDEAEAVKELERDLWVINTARKTMERIEHLRYLLKSGRNEGSFKKDHKGWVQKALEHYSIDEDKLDALENITIELVKNIWQRYNKAIKEEVLEVLAKEKNRDMEEEKLKEVLKKKGIREEWIEEVIEELIEEGRCYEPETGVLKTVKE